MMAESYVLSSRVFLIKGYRVTGENLIIVNDRDLRDKFIRKERKRENYLRDYRKRCRLHDFYESPPASRMREACPLCDSSN